MITMHHNIFGGRYNVISPYLANLIAYYKLDSNSNDFSDNSHNGIDTNVSYANAGKVGNSATYNGTTAKTLIPQSTDFDFSDVTADISFSVTMGVYFSGSGNAVLMCKYFNSGSGQWVIQSIGNQMFFYLQTNGSNYIYKITTAALSTGIWYHLGFTYDGSATTAGLKIYVNGTLATVTPVSAGTYTKMAITSNPVGLGVDSTGALNFFNGRIDETYVWKNRVIDATEMADAHTKFNAGQTLI